MGGGVRPPEYFRTLRGRALEATNLLTDEESAIKELVSAKDLDANFSFLPFTAETGEIYSALDVVTFPNQGVGLGRPVLEAATYGKPVVASGSRDGAGILLPGRTGFLLDDASPERIAAALRELIAEPELRHDSARPRRARARALRPAPQRARGRGCLRRAVGSRARAGSATSGRARRRLGGHDDHAAGRPRLVEPQPDVLRRRRSDPYEEDSQEYFREIDRRIFHPRYMRLTADASGKPFSLFVDFDSLSGKDVLDVGIGSGIATQMLAESGAKVTGVDLTDWAVETTRRRLEAFGLQADVRQADAEQLPFEDASFDLVFSWGVIHHSSDMDRALSELVRVTGPAVGSC